MSDQGSPPEAAEAPSRSVPRPTKDDLAAASTLLLQEVECLTRLAKEDRDAADRWARAPEVAEPRIERAKHLEWKARRLTRVLEWMGQGDDGT